MSKVESVTPPPDNSALASPSPTDLQSNGHGLFSKSRNARAQARHRAKRKAYIEQVHISLQLHFYFIKDTYASQIVSWKSRLPDCNRL